MITSFRECICPMGFPKITAVTDGGADRSFGIQRPCADQPESGIIAVHDGARPLITR